MGIKACAVQSVSCGNIPYNREAVADTRRYTTDYGVGHSPCKRNVFDIRRAYNENNYSLRTQASSEAQLLKKIKVLNKDCTLKNVFEIQ